MFKEECDTNVSEGIWLIIKVKPSYDAWQCRETNTESGFLTKFILRLQSRGKQNSNIKILNNQNYFKAEQKK